MSSSVNLQDSVETIARHSEKVFLTRSPFHLHSCGGCGCPSFKQPCSLCSYYPMGIERGSWSPKVATFAQFSKMIELSGPGGQDGTIATWYIRNQAHRKPSIVEQLVQESRKLEVAETETVWNEISIKLHRVYRELEAPAVYSGWQGLSEIKATIDGGYGHPPLDSHLQKMQDVLSSWVEAVHSNDNEVMLSAINDGIDLCNDPRVGRHIATMKLTQQALEKTKIALEEILHSSPKP